MRRVVLAIGLMALACGPAIHVKPIGSRVDPLPVPTPKPLPGAEVALIPRLSGGWRLNGGPADYTPATAAEPLGDELGRFRGLKSYATAEYVNYAQQVISTEAFVMSSPESATGAIKVGRPADARPLTGEELDDAFTASLRAEGRKGNLLVRVRWFEDKDQQLADAGIEALKDVLAAGARAGLLIAPAATVTTTPAADSPATSPIPSAAPASTPASAPSP